MKKLIIIQTAVPDYRMNFFSYLKKKLGNRFHLLAGDEYFENSVKSYEKIDYVPLNNHFLFKRKFLFQTGHWKWLFSKSVVVMELNPRIISNWIFLIVRKISGKKTVLWGHAWPRKGPNSSSDKLRNLMRNLSAEIIVYTRQQQQELQEKMPHKKIKAAPNALYHAEMMQAEKKPQARHLIYVGRFTALKKVKFLVEAFHRALPEIPPHVNLLMAGNGEEFQPIKNYIEKNNLQNRIKLLGHVSGYQQLKELYAQSFFSVSPGYVGLSVTQSLGFGVPLLVSKNENHSPEIEAVETGKNAVFFETDNTEDFVNKLREIYDKQEEWLAKREKISVFCKQNYSVEAMAKAFLELV